MTKYKSTIESIIVEAVDKDTGELTVTTQRKVVKHKVSADKFYMVYLHSINVYGELTGGEIKVLAGLNTFAEYDTNRVYLTADRRIKICDIMNMTLGGVANCIMSLKKKDIISGTRGTYTINPYYFWQGTLRERDNVMKELVHTFEILKDVNPQT